MKFENAFAVQAPAESVWQALMDVERVTPCMPGAEVLERLGDDSYKVGVKVKLGPISMLYRGQVEIVQRDDAARRATMRAKAKEARGQGTADASVHMSLAEQADGTHATIATEMALSGKAAAMGQGVIGDVAQKLVEEFASNLAQMLESKDEEAAPEAAGAAEAVAREAAGGPEAAATATPAASAGAPEIPAPATAQAPQARIPPAPSETPASPPPPTAPAPSALPVGKIAAGVIAGRLSNPRTLLITTAMFAAICGAIGYVLGRSR
jgi:carbon monoxide dehydrogenase subunit G